MECLIFYLFSQRHKDVSTTLQDVVAIELTFKLSDAEKVTGYSLLLLLKRNCKSIIN
jgi:hypothetical protein